MEGRTFSVGKLRRKMEHYCSSKSVSADNENELTDLSSISEPKYEGLFRFHSNRDYAICRQEQSYLNDAEKWVSQFSRRHQGQRFSGIWIEAAFVDSPLKTFRVTNLS
jgi:hypothetical protein